MENGADPTVDPIAGSGIEEARLAEHRAGKAHWKKWGPYLSERQWGTVREDYSDGGDAWNYFTHDQARSRAYRWGEDGIAGICDDQQTLCFALAFWNGRDPILKERLFGVTNSEGNHGEDVKDYYFYLDSTPTHSYMKYLYKYPQSAYPYDSIVATSRNRGRHEPEYELVDTGIFDDDRYFDIFVEYAKASPEDILIEVSAHNRGSERAELHILPTLWFRNQWSGMQDPVQPSLRRIDGDDAAVVHASHPVFGEYALACDGSPALLFTENETNMRRLYGAANRTPYVKDAFHTYVIGGESGAVNPANAGTKAAAHYRLSIEPGQHRVVRLRLSRLTARLPGDAGASERFGGPFDATLKVRRGEVDAFYGNVIPATLDRDAANVMRQALAGMLWSKQFYLFDVDRWLREHGAGPFVRGRKAAPRNESWHHMYNGDVISMPDKWEYPWYAAWDLAFHVVALSLVDPDFAKGQLTLMLRERYMHPNGQVPAYEWNFGDVNPPVHAWATIFTYRLEKAHTGVGDRAWLKSCFHKLLLNFTWWVNRKDRNGLNVFDGGFLGLDNIGVFDRSAPLPGGGYLEQADATAWMALFCQNMLEIAAELAASEPEYSDMAVKFTEHFLWIASAMVRIGEDTGMWDEEDGFFYDVLRLPDGTAKRLKVRSMVGLLPLCAATHFDMKIAGALPELSERFLQFIGSRREIVDVIHNPTQPGVGGSRLAAILDETKLRRVLQVMLDEREFLSPYGLRSMSRVHEEHPYTFEMGGQRFEVRYLPAESDSGMFGGNSNWRGPIWMPTNALVIRALLQYYLYYGDAFRIECPTGSGRLLTLYEIAEEIARRLAGIFLRDAEGRRALHGGVRKFQEDPHWHDHVLFYEYFHGDNGAGIGASHQTGWTGLVARFMHFFAIMAPEQGLAGGKSAYAERTAGIIVPERAAE